MNAHAAEDAPTTPVKAVYQHLDCLLTGVEKLKGAHLDGWTVLAPLPRHEIEEAVYGGRPSPVRWWTLSGAVIGVNVGFLLPALTAAQWPMINPGGKPVVSLVPYGVIMFECTILFGALFTFAGMLFHCGLPALFPRALRDPRVSDGSFAIVFPSAPGDSVQRIVALLRGSGATEVTTGAATAYEVPNA
jgi:molybdopterin-containing oxidoreductase family membrane subunit